MNYWSYIAHSLKPHRRRLVMATLSSLAMMIIVLAGPLLLAVFIDVVVSQGRFELLAPVMVGFILIEVLSAATRMLNSYLITLLGQRVIFDIRLDLYRRVQLLSHAYLANMPAGKLMERIRGDVEQLKQLMTNSILSLTVELLVGLLTLVVMFFISAKLTLLVVVAIGFFLINHRYFVRRIQKVQRRERRKMDILSAVAQERLTASIAVKAFGNERLESRHFLKHNFTSQRLQHRFKMLGNGYKVTSTVIGGTTQLMVLLLGTYMVIQGKMTYGAVTAMAAFSTRLISPVVQLSGLANVIQQAKVSLDRIFELMQAEPDFIDQSGIRLPKLRGEIAFHLVGFHYRQGEPVLDNFNLYVAPGQTVALVGQTGCGKTTITKLLYRYFEPQTGHLEIDGHDVRDLAPRWYRRQLALVPQDPVVFDTTIAENIAYGRPHVDRARIEKAARLAELESLIDRLANGLDSRLGEDGVRLSLGEKQRVCIARAVLMDPAILILDEATSSLDSQSEVLIQKALKRIMAKRTCFVIAHRLSTIVEADLIVVVDKGRVLESGTHGQLCSNPDGRYRRLLEVQLANQHHAEVAS